MTKMTRLIYWRILQSSRLSTRHAACDFQPAINRAIPFSIPRRYASTSKGETPLREKEAKQLQAFIRELETAAQSSELSEQHVVRALEVIRPMVRPLRKERKSAKAKTGKPSSLNSINPGHEQSLPSNNPPPTSRQMTTQLHSSSTLPRLGCPIPLPLEKSHGDALRGLLPLSSEQQGQNNTTPGKRSTINTLSTTTRESLLRAQEALYDVLLVRSTLTYWLHFAKVQWKKGQRTELVEKIAKLRNVAKDQLVLGGSTKVSKPVIDNGLERYTLFKYRSQAMDQETDLGAAGITSAVYRRPLFYWETLFEGLSTSKQGYRREVYEAKADIISYSLSRGKGNELAWMAKPRSNTEKFDSVVSKGSAIHPSQEKPAVVVSIGDDAVAEGAFFTRSYSAPLLQSQGASCSGRYESSSAVTGWSSTGAICGNATTLLGQRIPLEHQLQTSLSWPEPSLSSPKSLRVAAMTPIACPPKIEWTSSTHEIRQRNAGKEAEKELYNRFLDFVSSEMFKVHESTLDALPLENFKTYSEIFAVRSGIGKDSLLATAIWRSYWDHQDALLISTDGSSKSDDIASVGVHFGTSAPVEFKGALPREWAAQGSYTAEWFAICYALWLSLDLQSPTKHLPNISGRSTLVFCTDSSGIVTSITKPVRVSEKDAQATNKSWTPLVLLCRQMIVRLAAEGKDVKFTWMPRLSTVGLTRAHELADDVYGKITTSSKAVKEKKKSKQQTKADNNEIGHGYRPLGWFCL